VLNRLNFCHRFVANKLSSLKDEISETVTHSDQLNKLQNTYSSYDLYDYVKFFVFV